MYRRAMLAILSVAIGLAVLTLICANTRKDRINWKNANRLKEGMTEAQVEEIFGVPAGIYNADLQWVPIPADHKLWFGDGAGVEVWFDDAGRVSAIGFMSTPKEQTRRRDAVTTVRGWVNELFDKLEG